MPLGRGLRSSLAEPVWSSVTMLAHQHLAAAEPIMGGLPCDEVYRKHGIHE
jgi:hypothetical protein